MAFKELAKILMAFKEFTPFFPPKAAATPARNGMDGTVDGRSKGWPPDSAFSSGWWEILGTFFFEMVGSFGYSDSYGLQWDPWS